MQDSKRDNPENFHSVRELLKTEGVSTEDSPAYKDCSDRILDFSIVTGDFFEIPDPDTGFLRFKKIADVVGFRHIAETLPEFQHLVVMDKENIPYYAENLDAVRKDSTRRVPYRMDFKDGKVYFTYI